MRVCADEVNFRKLQGVSQNIEELISEIETAATKYSETIEKERMVGEDQVHVLFLNLHRRDAEEAEKNFDHEGRANNLATIYTKPTKCRLKFHLRDLRGEKKSWIWKNLATEYTNPTKCRS